MALNINTNIGALGAAASATAANRTMESAMERLSTGLRINTAADDAAGMAISSRMESQIRGLNMAIRNAADGQALIDTTEGAHNEVTNILQRMRELAVQSANDTNVSADRANLQAEVTQLIGEMNRISSQTTWNGVAVIDGTFTGKQLQIGAEDGQILNFEVDSVAATALGNHTVTTNVWSKLNAVANAIDATKGDVTVSGRLGSETLNMGASATAADLASAANNVSGSTGVTAKAETNAKLNTFTLGGGATSDTVSFNIGTTSATAVSIGSVVITNANDLSGIRDAINNISGRTGITATLGSSNADLLLKEANGNNIVIENYTSANATKSTMVLTAMNIDGTPDTTGTATLAAVAGTSDDAVVTGQVKFSSTGAFVATGGSGSADDGAGFVVAAGVGSSLGQVAAIDIDTATGAASAIDVIDAAIEKISAARGDLGAISNRLDNTISNLTNIATNISSSQSRIQDADFATESTNLAKAQILQQAATAMLAQANASKQGVLSLLQG